MLTWSVKAKVCSKAASADQSTSSVSCRLTSISILLSLSCAVNTTISSVRPSCTSLCFCTTASVAASTLPISLLCFALPSLPHSLLLNICDMTSWEGDTLLLGSGLLCPGNSLGLGFRVCLACPFQSTGAWTTAISALFASISSSTSTLSFSLWATSSISQAYSSEFAAEMDANLGVQHHLSMCVANPAWCSHSAPAWCHLSGELVLPIASSTRAPPYSFPYSTPYKSAAVTAALTPCVWSL